jgi:hypothetical protein
MRAIFCKNLSFWDQVFNNKEVEIVKEISIPFPPYPEYSFWVKDDFGEMFQESYGLIESIEEEGIAIYNLRGDK